MDDEPKLTTPTEPTTTAEAATPAETIAPAETTRPTDGASSTGEGAMPSGEGASSSGEGAMPKYKGAPLDPERGPGLGCFWTQVVLLAIFLVLTPLTVVWAWPSWISAALLFATLILLLFVGQTTIFLLRLVAADRRTARRRPMSPTARKTVGDLEEEGQGPPAA